MRHCLGPASLWPRSFLMAQLQGFSGLWKSASCVDLGDQSLSCSKRRRFQVKAEPFRHAFGTTLIDDADRRELLWSHHGQEVLLRYADFCCFWALILSGCTLASHWGPQWAEWLLCHSYATLVFVASCIMHCRGIRLDSSWHHTHTRPPAHAHFIMRYMLVVASCYIHLDIMMNWLNCYSVVHSITHSFLT